MPDREPIGLIAGAGLLPVLEARGLVAAGHPVICAAFRGMTDPDLRPLCSTFTEVGIAQIGKWTRVLRRHGVTKAIMVGRVDKTVMYLSRLQQARVLLPDLPGVLFWFGIARKDRRSQVMLAGLADTLGRRGVQLIDSTAYIPDHLATAGLLTRRAPNASQQADIAFGWPVLMRMNDLDIGQAIAVRERDIIAVEAIEGTARMIARAGELCRKPGWVLLKGPNDRKDPRFDVPCIGPDTIEQLRAAGAGCLAVAAGKVILMNRPAVLAAADRAGIAVVGIDSPPIDPGP